MSKKLLILLLVFAAAAGCVRDQPQVIFVTATFEPTLAAASGASDNPPLPAQQLSPVPAQIVNQPTPDPTRVGTDDPDAPRQYVIQPGDTMYGIALSNNLSLETLLAANPDLADPNIISVGQVIHLPGPPDQQTSDFKIIPDSRLVRGPGSADFDVAAFIQSQPGYIRTVTDEVPTHLATYDVFNETLSAAGVIERVSLEYSIDPRLLLALLEYRAGWLSNPEPPEESRSFPLISVEASSGINRSGLYRQLAWAANELNRGYYGWKNRGWTTLEFDGGTRLLYAPGLNAGTVALQYFLSLNTGFEAWASQILPVGLYQVYYAYFGDPFAGAIDPLVPSGIQQPELVFPFSSGETWFFTGGPHGGWGSGSAWSAVDFAPPDERTERAAGCYQSEFWATAVAPGVIARSSGGVVVLDLDSDGDETTGWTVLYLHIASAGRVPAGAQVQTGDRIGHPSCEGGFSNATHMHIARRYNGEWIPADCEQCAPGQERPPFAMNGWTIVGLPKQEYQGYMVNSGEQRVAEQGRLTPDNRVSW